MILTGTSYTRQPEPFIVSVLFFAGYSSGYFDGELSLTDAEVILKPCNELSRKDFLWKGKLGIIPRANMKKSLYNIKSQKFPSGHLYIVQGLNPKYPRPRTSFAWHILNCSVRIDLSTFSFNVSLRILHGTYMVTLPQTDLRSLYEAAEELLNYRHTICKRSLGMQYSSRASSGGTYHRQSLVSHSFSENYNKKLFTEFLLSLYVCDWSNVHFVLEVTKDSDNAHFNLNVQSSTTDYYLKNPKKVLYFSYSIWEHTQIWYFVPSST